MGNSPNYPSLYEINTRIWLNELSRKKDRRVTLADVPDAELDALAALGFDWIWLLGAWQTGPAGREVARTHAGLRRDYAAALPDFRDEDIAGSPFAIQSYHVHTDFGGDMALSRIRERLRQRGLKLLLDFVPNHTALDHSWANEHPEYYVQGDEADLEREPHNFTRMATRAGPVIFAFGRDPYFPGWTDTLQLNYRHAGFRHAMIGELTRVAGQCDGVRCDMAMLLLPDVIARTWGYRSTPRDGSPPVDESFWPQAINTVRQLLPEFVFMAEVYWDLEWTLQQQGFSFTYDKRLYDRLCHEGAQSVRGHLCADHDFQSKSVRFLENHDEPRAAAAFAPGIHEAAAVVTFFVPGLRFFHDGQFDGRRLRTVIQLARRADETPDPRLQMFYARLLQVLKRPELRDGRWRLLNCRPAWDGNPTAANFISFAWDSGPRRLLIAVNFGPTQGQSIVEVPLADLAGRQWLLADLLGPHQYARDGDELVNRGLYLDLEAWAFHVFEVRANGG
jgi:Alpha amylase, catalytic domain